MERRNVRPALRYSSGSSQSGKEPPLMKYLSTMVACLLAAAAPACFRPQLACGPCGPTPGRVCPSGLMCRADNLCVAGENDVCPSPSTASGGAMGPGGDGAAGSAAGGAGVAGGPGGTAGGPSSTCTDHCCIGAQCLQFPASLQQGLLFWADGTSLSEPGYALTAWRDRSHYANDILPVNPETPPRVQLYEGGAVAQIDQPGMVIASKNGLPTAFGVQDFTILVLARCEPAPESCVIRQARSDGARPLMSVALYCNSSGDSVLPPPTTPTHAELRVMDDNVYPNGGWATVVSRRTDLTGNMHLFGARRIDGTRLQLRVDGVVEGETTIPEQLDLANQTPIYVGSCAALLRPYTTTFLGEVGAAVVVGGAMSDAEVASLETFLLSTRATAP